KDDSEYAGKQQSVEDAVAASQRRAQLRGGRGGPNIDRDGGRADRTSAAGAEGASRLRRQPGTSVSERQLSGGTACHHKSVRAVHYERDLRGSASSHGRVFGGCASGQVEGEALVGGGNGEAYGS